MLILLPIVSSVSLLAVFLILKPDWTWRLVLLRVSALLSVYMVITNEILSLFQALTRTSLSILWSLPILFSLILLRNRIPELRRTFQSLIKLPQSWSERSLLLIILSVCLITAFVAKMSPPNTWDSLNTHMSRVAHWAQENSLRPYATGIEKQLYYPPFPGIAILQSYVLAGGDIWANFAQWIAMLLSAVGVSYLASLFGLRNTTQWFVATFVLTLPLGIAQASSTMTDYLVALWIVIVAIESVRLTLNSSLPESIFFISVATGLAINTKPTSFAYLLPFGVYVSIQLLKRLPFTRFVLAGLVCITILGMINAGYFSRNLALYKNPLGPSTGIAIHSNEILDWRVVISNTVRNASLHAWSPIQIIRSATYRAIIELHDFMELSVTDPRTSVHDTFAIRPPSTDEKKSGNFFHAIIILGVLILLGLKNQKKNKPIWIYALTVLSTFLVLSTAYKFSIFGSRYHLAFFVLSAPVVGVGLDKYSSNFFLTLLGLFLFFSSWNWFVSIDQRPIWPKQEGGVSLMESTRQDLYFPIVPYYRERYQEMTDLISKNSCDSVGVFLGGAGAEYPIWPYMGAPREGLQIQWIVEGAPSAKYFDPSFEPCAVICDITCPKDWQTVRNLPLSYEKSEFRLYLR